MTILYVVHSAVTPTLQALMAAQGEEHRVIVFDLGQSTDHHRLLALIEECDRVVCW